MVAGKHKESAGSGKVLPPLTAASRAVLEAQRPQLNPYQELPADPQRPRSTPGQWWALFFDEFGADGKRARADRAIAHSRKSENVRRLSGS